MNEPQNFAKRRAQPPSRRQGAVASGADQTAPCLLIDSIVSWPEREYVLDVGNLSSHSF
jgi:hypothetical protein